MLAVTLLLAVSFGCAVLLRWARCPGWRVVGGVAAGLLLGPSILGRVLPDDFAAIFDGGREQRVAVRALASRQGADLIAARRAGLSPDELTALADRQAQETRRADERLQRARWDGQRPLRLATGGLVALMLLGASVFAVEAGRRGGGLAAAASIGAWSAALPGGLAWFALRGLWDLPAVESGLGAAALAIGPWALTPADRDAADQAELGGARMVQTAGRIATVMALVVALAALGQGMGVQGVLWAAPLAAVIAAWPLPAARSRVRAVVRGVVELVIVPAVAATVAVRIDLTRDFALWLVVVVLLLSGDGRWVGAVTGTAILGGRRGLRTMRLVLGSMAAGPTQLAVTAIAAATWTIEPRLALALLLGAVMVEVSVPMRRGMARRLEKEEEGLGVGG